MVREGHRKLSRSGSISLALAGLMAATICGCQASIHDAAARGALETIEAMLDAEPPRVEERNRLGKTALHYAVSYGRSDAISLLVVMGAKVNAKDNTGMSPLHVAAMFDRPREGGQLIELGADVGRRDDFGDTPLHMAAMHGRMNIIETLLEAGADPNSKNNEDLTPLALAQKHRRHEAAERLGAISDSQQTGGNRAQ